MLVLGDDFPIGIHHIEGKATELCTLSPVGTPPEAMLAHIALTAIAHAQGTVHKDFEGCIGYGFVYLSDLLQRKFACQDHLSETRFGQELHLFHVAIVHLSAGMQRDGRKVQSQQPHVLHNQGIHPYAIQLPNQFLRFGEFLVLQDGI